MENTKQTATKDFLQEKIKQIEIIVKDLDDNILPIEQLMDRYEEGMKLTQEAKQFLSNLEGRLINISEQKKGATE